MSRVLWLVGAGGALGSGARIALGMTAQGLSDQGAIAATLAVNVLGAALIGWLGARAPGPLFRAFWMTGFCGGFTTFSMLSFEVVMLWDHAPSLSLAYSGTSVLLCGLAVALGWRMGHR